MGDWFDDLPNHPSFKDDEDENTCRCCGVPVFIGKYCSRGCEIEDNK